MERLCTQASDCRLYGNSCEVRTKPDTPQAAGTEAPIDGGFRTTEADSFLVVLQWRKTLARSLKGYEVTILWQPSCVCITVKSCFLSSHSVRCRASTKMWLIVSSVRQNLKAEENFRTALLSFAYACLAGCHWVIAAECDSVGVSVGSSPFGGSPTSGQECLATSCEEVQTLNCLSRIKISVRWGSWPVYQSVYVEVLMKVSWWSLFVERRRH